MDLCQQDNISVSELRLCIPTKVPAPAQVAAYWQRRGNPGKAFFTQSIHQTLQVLTAEFATRDWGMVRHEIEESDAHDHYFRVVRVEGDPAEVFVAALASARLLLQTGLASPADLHNALLVDRTLGSLAEDLGLDALAAEFPPHAAEAAIEAAGGRQPSALERWCLGHHIFAVVTQSLILAFDAMGHAVARGDKPGARQWARQAQQLFDASAAAFAYTAEFSTEDYETKIRPTMSPPLAPLSLSGLMSADHKHLAMRMRDLRPALQVFSQDEAALHRDLAEALHRAYAAHILVCERFVGSKPSLLTEGRSERSGPDLLRQFQLLRQKPFEHPEVVKRIAPGHTPLPTCPRETSEFHFTTETKDFNEHA